MGAVAATITDLLSVKFLLSVEAEGAVWATCKAAIDADGPSGTVSVEVKALW